MANGSFLGQKTKITVVRKLKLDDVAREYGQIRPGAESGDFIPDCPFFEEGQEFIIETGGSDFAGSKRFYEVHLVDKLPAGIVQKNHAVLHFRDIFPVDESCVFRCQIAVQGDHVSNREKLILGNVLRDR